MAYAVASDVAEELGLSVLDPAQDAQAQRWLRRVEASIRLRIPNLAALVESGALDRNLVADVEAAAVARKLLNPTGLRVEQIDDYSYTRAPDAAGVDVTLTDEEWALLTPSRINRGAFSVTPNWSD